jgi:hypothetical protein
MERIGSGLLVLSLCLPVGVQRGHHSSSSHHSSNAHHSTSTHHTSSHYYTNVDGQRVHRPVHSRAAPAGATAKCADGTYSSSHHSRGTAAITAVFRTVSRIELPYYQQGDRRFMGVRDDLIRCARDKDDHVAQGKGTELDAQAAKNLRAEWRWLNISPSYGALRDWSNRLDCRSGYCTQVDKCKRFERCMGYGPMKSPVDS